MTANCVVCGKVFKKRGTAKTCGKVCSTGLKREWYRRRYAANPEKRKEQERGYRLADPDKVREKNRRSYAANAEKRKEQKRQYYTANTEKVREQSHRSY